LPPDLYEALRPDARDPVIDALRERLAQTQGPDRRDRVELSAIDFHWPNASLVHGFDHWLGYNPLRMKWYADATGAIDHVAVPDQRKFAPLFARYASPMADLLGVRWIATGVPAQQLDKSLRPGDLVEAGRNREAYLYENPRALPRVLFATQARAANFEAMIATGVWPATDFRTTVLLENPPEPRPRGPGRARISAYANTEIVIDVSSRDGGWVALNDVWHPWWRAEIDGKPAEILRANAIFRAVEVPAGEHRVRFTFHPFAGLWAQLTGGR